jgi:alpha-tubulin suppressor-like RCC1 family protein
MDADSATSGRDAASGEVAFGDAGPTVVTSVVAGLYHACAIVNGGVQCWGRNDGKQLGNPSVGDYSTVPVPVEGLGCGVSSVCAGYHHTCAVVNGGVKCWGSNDEGQLGTAAVTGATAVPVPVPGLTNVEAIACGRDHTCALHVGGIDCWGDNSYSELGSTGVQSPGPHGVTGVFPGGSVTAIAANGHGTCAIVNGGLECWGDDTYGQLGNGVAGVNAFVPYQPPGLASGVSSVAIGDGESVCAVVNGGVQCSGNAFYGVSGFPSEKHVFTPLPKPLDSGVQALSSGYEFTCALVNGAALCWGDNGAGQLGSGSGPYVLGLQSGVQSITTGDYFACALVNGTVWCWGWDMDGQLARGRIVGGSYLAEPVTGLRAIPSCPYNHCLDHQLNGDETGVDCGGECPECALGEPCAADSDCISNACDGESLQCVFVQCSDHRKDGDETDTDCGGPSCGGCWNGAHCAHNFDCLSGFCSAHVCQ